MSYYKSKDNIEMDDMNIKSHLNASLSFNEISVSEELIQRTLNAVKQQNRSEASSAAKLKKGIAWNKQIQRFAGVAAALVVVMLGFGLIRNIPGTLMGGKKDAGYSENYMSTKNSADSAAPEQSEAKLNSLSEEEASYQEENMTEDTAVSDEIEDDGYVISATENDKADLLYGITDGTIDSDEDFTDGLRSDKVDQENLVKTDKAFSQVLNFSEIFILAPAQLEELTITSKAKDRTITITDQQGIQEFYSLMDQYTFQIASEASIDRYYSVELNGSSLEDAAYTIWVGENITVKYKNGADSQVLAYHSSDDEALRSDLDIFFTINDK